MGPAGLAGLKFTWHLAADGRPRRRKTKQNSTCAGLILKRSSLICGVSSVALLAAMAEVGLGRRLDHRQQHGRHHPPGDRNRIQRDRRQYHDRARLGHQDRHRGRRSRPSTPTITSTSRVSSRIRAVTGAHRRPYRRRLCGQLHRPRRHGRHHQRDRQRHRQLRPAARRRVGRSSATSPSSPAPRSSSTARIRWASRSMRR